MVNDYVDKAEDTLEDAGIKALDKITKKTKTRIVYDRDHKILGFKNDRR